MPKYNSKDLSRVLTRYKGASGNPTTSPGALNSWYNETIPASVAIVVSFATTSVVYQALHMTGAVSCRYLTVIGGYSGREVQACIYSADVVGINAGNVSLTAVTPTVKGEQNTKFDNTDNYLYVFDFGTEHLINPYVSTYFVCFKSLNSGSTFGFNLAECVKSPVGTGSFTDNNTSLQRNYSLGDFSPGVRTMFIGLYSAFGYNVYCT